MITPWQALSTSAPAGADLYSLGCTASKFLPILDECFTTPTGQLGFLLNHYAIPDGVMAATPAVEDIWDLSDMFMADYSHPDLPGDFVSEVITEFTWPITGDYELGVVCTGKCWLYVDNELVIDNATNQTIGPRFFGNGTIEEKGVIKVTKGQKYIVRVVHDSRRPAWRQQVSNTPFVVSGLRIGAFPLVDENLALKHAVEAAKHADTVVLVAGLNSDWESEGYDRSAWSLPMRADELISAVADVNPNTVVVLQCGSAVAMPWLDKVAGVVYSWYGGNEAGNGISDIVYGRSSPAGRLPLFLPKREKDIAAGLNFKSARTRAYYEEGIWVGYKHHNARGIAPLFPFGHGLSYTTFEYEDLAVETTGTTAADWCLKAVVTVIKAGSVATDHSVHFYIAPPDGTFSIPKSRSRHSPGNTTWLPERAAASRNTWRAEVGTWAIKIGVDAATMAVSAAFQVEHPMEWTGL